MQLQSGTPFRFPIWILIEFQTLSGVETHPTKRYLDDTIAPSICNVFWCYNRDIFINSLVQSVVGLILTGFAILEKKSPFEDKCTVLTYILKYTVFLERIKVRLCCATKILFHPHINLYTYDEGDHYWCSVWVLKSLFGWHDMKVWKLYLIPRYDI